MMIKALRILPPLAIGRLGSADEPLDNYTIKDDPNNPLGFRRIEGACTLVVDANTGEIKEKHIPDIVQFKHKGKVRPVAPFLEVFAVTQDDQLVPLTYGLLRSHGLRDAKISWRVRVANRKVVRRTEDSHDLVKAETPWIWDHKPYRLEGKCDNFIRREAFIDFGYVRFIKPNPEFPEIRLRFTPAKGLIYGPKEPADWSERNPNATYPIPEDRQIYNEKKCWAGFGSDDKQVTNETVPPSLFAIWPPAPPWLNNNIAISLGYLDDACDGFVEVRVTKGKVKFTAKARITAGPPAPVPDSLFVRSLADDLEQVIHGPTVDGVESIETTRARALDIVRRAYETVRFMNVALMNGNNFKGRSALELDSMPEEEAATTERAIRPVMSAGTVDTLAIMGLHAQVYAALQGGAAPWFVDLLRRPDEVADYTDRGRRKMPALMCGADNGYLALTYRQIDTVRKAAEGSPSVVPDAKGEPGLGKLTPRNLSAQLHYEAKGNPISSRPVTAVANCCPGLEVDFRAVWRRMFEGIVLREYDNLVMEADEKRRNLIGHRLLAVRVPITEARDKSGKTKKVPKMITVPFTTPIKGPAPSDPDGEIKLTTDLNPQGLAPLEWSNALAWVLYAYRGNPDRKICCYFTKEPSPTHQQYIEDPKIKNPKNPKYLAVELKVRDFFEADTAVISDELAQPGELTQGLCSPWQNDYRECSCYYWASARPDYVNVEPAPNGLSTGDNWFQKERTGDYVPDDYSDARLVLYDDLFKTNGPEKPNEWERWIRFQIGGRDAPEGNED